MLPLSIVYNLQLDRLGPLAGLESAMSSLSNSRFPHCHKISNANLQSGGSSTEETSKINVLNGLPLVQIVQVLLRRSIYCLICGRERLSGGAPTHEL